MSDMTTMPIPELITEVRKATKKIDSPLISLVLGVLCNRLEDQQTRIDNLSDRCIALANELETTTLSRARYPSDYARLIELIAILNVVVANPEKATHTDANEAWKALPRHLVEAIEEKENDYS